MSLTLWIEYRQIDGEIYTDDVDKFQIASYMEPLSTFCEEMGVLPLAEMLDYSKLVDSPSGPADSDDEEDFYPADESQIWVSPREAIQSFDTLYEALSNDASTLAIPPHHAQELLQELEACLRLAQMALDDDSDYFHMQLGN